MEQSKFYQIKNVTEHEYTLVGCDGSVITRPIRDIDKLASAFSIKDAKDGDVLVCNINKAEIGGDIEKLPNITPTICVYQNVIKDKDYIHTYCSLYNGSSLVLSNSMYYNTFVYNIQPATKEQRNLLFQKMHEAGYEWDAEKKELKMLKKQDKPEWTDEDEERLQSCIIELQGKGLMGGVDTLDTKWLKSLKQRMEKQQ